MATTTLDPEIIEAVHAHLQADGSRKIKDLALITGDNTKDVNTAYVAAVAEKYPEAYQKDTDDTNEVPKQQEKPQEPSTEVAYSLLDPQGILQPLVVVSNKPGKLILKFDEPKDVVSIIYRGTLTEVDLYQIRKTGVSPLEGLSAQAVLVMGEAARG